MWRSKALISTKGEYLSNPGRYFSFGKTLARRKRLNFSLLGPVLSHQFSPKWTNSLPWRGKSHANSLLGVVGKTKVKNFLAKVSLGPISPCQFPPNGASDKKLWPSVRTEWIKSWTWLRQCGFSSVNSLDKKESPVLRLPTAMSVRRGPSSSTTATRCDSPYSRSDRWLKHHSVTWYLINRCNTPFMRYLCNLYLTLGCLRRPY